MPNYILALLVATSLTFGAFAQGTSGLINSHADFMANKVENVGTAVTSVPDYGKKITYKDKSGTVVKLKAKDLAWGYKDEDGREYMKYKGYSLRAVAKGKINVWVTTIFRITFDGEGNVTDYITMGEADELYIQKDGGTLYRVMGRQKLYEALKDQPEVHDALKAEKQSADTGVIFMQAINYCEKYNKKTGTYQKVAQVK